MFKKSRSKSNVHVGSKESLDGYGSGNVSSPETSSENLSNSRDKLVDARSIYQISQFEMHFLGMVQDVNLGGIHTRDPDIQLIDKVEEAQLENKIGLVAHSKDLVTFTISKHGVKVLDKDKKEVIQRHPLHTVAQGVYYIDSFMKHNVALKIGQVGRSVYDCYVFQCHTEEQAQSVCSSMKNVFDVVANRIS